MEKKRKLAKASVNTTATDYSFGGLWSTETITLW